MLLTKEEEKYFEDAKRFARKLWLMESALIMTGFSKKKAWKIMSEVLKGNIERWITQ